MPTSLTWPIAPPRPTRHLREQLERSLAGSEIREVQTQIGGHNTDQRHTRDVVPLGHHLCAHEYIDFVPVKGAQDPTLGPLARGGIAIEPPHASVREHRGHLLLEALRPEAQERPLGALAVDADRAGILTMTAVVAAQLPLLGNVAAPSPSRSVVDQRDVAVLAAQRKAAGETVGDRKSVV